MLNGFQSLWSKPYCAGNHTENYFMEDYELLTMVLSALMWRKNNGGICLYADAPAIGFIRAKGLEPIWNLGIEEIMVPEIISEKVFWAAGKMYALRKMKMPAVMVDLDLVVWKNLDKVMEDTDICAVHREGIFPETYPDLSFFHMSPDYVFDREWRTDVLPVNTCMLYIKDEEFKNYYADSAIEFMSSCVEQEENLCHMVFAEQRLLAMCAHKKNQKISTFFPDSASIHKQDIFTHLWGYKNILKYNYQERLQFNQKIKNRVRREFPEEYELVKNL